MEQIKKELLRIFNNKSMKYKKYRFNDLKRALSGIQGIKSSDILEALDELELEGEIYIMEYSGDRKFYRAFPHELNYVQGVIAINKFGEGLMDVDNEHYKVKVDNLNGALNGDTVVITVTNKRDHGYQIAKVDKIIKRKDGLVICEVKTNGKDLYLEPFSAKIDGHIILSQNDMKDLVEGDRVQVRIDQLNDKNTYFAEYIKYIGHKDDPDAEIQMIAIKNGITIDFSEAALEEAEACPTEVSNEDKIGRLDLTSENIFSIDGADTKDRDDAISLRILPNGNYLLGVHIADVSHYVHPGMALWDEANERGNSVYLVNTVIPMLPHKLSNGICSLNPDVERLSLSCIMEVDHNGQVLNYDFKDTVIKSKKAMTYEDVNECLENDNIVQGYEEYMDDLLLFKEFSNILEKAKIKRGYVDFGSNDIKIKLDEEGIPIEIKQVEAHVAQKIIENCMLLAGECAANYVVLPAPYRVHESPEPEKVDEAFNLLSKSGIRVRSVHEITNGKVIQSILSQIKDMDERKIAANIILRSMNRAGYSVENYGHFGLGLPCYGHFTSPIRRIADLRMHYSIRQQRDNLFNMSQVNDYYEEMEQVCKHATRTELNADQAERDANQAAMMKYIEEHLGEKFPARVTYCNSHGIFVKTAEGIDGKILLEDIEGDTFNFDDRTNSYKGKKSKIKIKIGTPLLLTALDTKKEYRTINFGLEHEDFVELRDAIKNKVSNEDVMKLIKEKKD